MTTTSYRAGAFFEGARRLGIDVTVGSDRAQALAAANPAGDLVLDFAAPQEAVSRIVAFARDFPIRAVVAADDDGAILAAMASEALGLKHNSVAAVTAARDKHRMRERLAAAGIPGPWFERFEITADPAEVARRVRYPCVVKPLSLSASRGVLRADDPAQLAAAFRRAGALLERRPPVAATPEASGSILIEGYLPGVEVALEGLVDDGKLRVLALFDKPDPLVGPLFEETIYVTPSRLAHEAQEAIAARTQQVITALGLTRGPVHAELRWNDDGAWPLEIAPRSIGGLCSRALHFEGGVPLEELILRHALGLSGRTLPLEQGASGVMMIPIPHAGFLRGVGGQEEARRVEGIEDIRITIPIGDRVVPLPEGSRYLGFIFAGGEAPRQVETALREAHRRLAFDIQPGAG